MTFFLIKTGGDVADVNKAAIGIVQGCVMLPDKSKMHFAMERTEISAGHLSGKFGPWAPQLNLRILPAFYDVRQSIFACMLPPVMSETAE